MENEDKGKEEKEEEEDLEEVGSKTI